MQVKIKLRVNKLKKDTLPTARDSSTVFTYFLFFQRRWATRDELAIIILLDYETVGKIERSERKIEKKYPKTLRVINNYTPDDARRYLDRSEHTGAVVRWSVIRCSYLGKLEKVKFSILEKRRKNVAGRKEQMSALKTLQHVRTDKFFHIMGTEWVWGNVEKFSVEREEKNLFSRRVVGKITAVIVSESGRKTKKGKKLNFLFVTLYRRKKKGVVSWFHSRKIKLGIF